MCAVSPLCAEPLSVWRMKLLMPLMGRFLPQLGKTNSCKTVGSDSALIFQWNRNDVAKHVKECAHITFPTLLDLLSFTRDPFPRNTHLADCRLVSGSLLINPGFITCNDAVHNTMRPSVELNQVSLGPFHDGPLLFKGEILGIQQAHCFTTPR